MISKKLIVVKYKMRAKLIIFLMKTKKTILPKHAEKGARLLEFYKARGYKNKRAFSSAMGIFPQDLNKYFDGVYDPINLTESLVKEGCDIVWLATGQSWPKPAHFKYGDTEFHAIIDSSDVLEWKERKIFTFEEYAKLKAENEAFRKALTPEMVAIILKDLKKDE